MRVDLVLYGLSAAFAAFTATSSNLAPHRAWGSIALWGYLAALVLAFFAKHHRVVLTWLTWAAVAILPMIVLSVQNKGQEEVFVVENSAERLLNTGSPYLSRAGIEALPEPLLGYTPYQPGMTVFGLPNAIFGNHWWTDSRIWFAVVTGLALCVAIGLVKPGSARASRQECGRPSNLALQCATVLPICALTLATGGDDMPVMALCLLAFACAARSRFGWAGMAIGAAAAMKLFAWPVLVVIGVYAIVKHSGWRFALPAVGIPVLTLIPVLLSNVDAFVENVIRFPSGQGLVISPAASPLVGKLIADHVPGGRTIAMVLLGLTALAIGIWLLRRPPRTAREVAIICAIGLFAAILLMPSTRFGYLLYPIAFLAWSPSYQDPQIGGADPEPDAQ